LKSMKIYVAGPYSGSTLEEIQENVRRAMEAGLKIWKKGHFPYIPHLTHWPDMLARELEIEMDWEDYMNWHAPWVDHCDALFLLAESKGALLEYNRVKKDGKLVFHTLEEIPSVERALTWAQDCISDDI